MTLTAETLLPEVKDLLATIADAHGEKTLTIDDDAMGDVLTALLESLEGEEDAEEYAKGGTARQYAFDPNEARDEAGKWTAGQTKRVEGSEDHPKAQQANKLGDKARRLSEIAEQTGDETDHRRAAKAHAEAAFRHGDVSEEISWHAVNAGMSLHKEMEIRAANKARSDKAHAVARDHQDQGELHTASEEYHRAKARAIRAAKNAAPIAPPADTGQQQNARHGNPSRYAWDESQHPRGKPENAGEFTSGGGSESEGKSKPLPVATIDPAKSPTEGYLDALTAALEHGQQHDYEAEDLEHLRDAADDIFIEADAAVNKRVEEMKARQIADVVKEFGEHAKKADKAQLDRQLKNDYEFLSDAMTDLKDAYLAVVYAMEEGEDTDEAMEAFESAKDAFNTARDEFRTNAGESLWQYREGAFDAQQEAAAAQDDAWEGAAGDIAEKLNGYLSNDDAAGAEEDAAIFNGQLEEAGNPFRVRFSDEEGEYEAYMPDEDEESKPNAKQYERRQRKLCYARSQWAVRRYAFDPNEPRDPDGKWAAHAAALKAHGETVATLKAAHAGAMAANAEASAKQTADHEENVKAWQAREDERTARGEKVSAIEAHDALPADLQSLAGDAFADAHTAAWAQSFGADGLLMTALKANGATDKELKKLATVAARGQDALAKFSERAKAAHGKVDAVRAKLAAHDATEPADPGLAEPDYPDNDEDEAAVKAYDTAQAAYEKAQAAYDALHDAWEGKHDAIEEKVTEAEEKAQDATDALTDGWDAWWGKMDEETTETKDAIEARIAAEGDEDQEPEEPDEIEEPEEPDYPDEPPEPDEDEEDDETDEEPAAVAALSSSERSAAVTNIGLIVGSGRANLETEQALMTLYGSDSLGELARALKSGTEDKLRQAAAIVARDPGANGSVKSALEKLAPEQHQRRGQPRRYSTDASGHEHKGEGPGGGQFTGSGEGGNGVKSTDGKGNAMPSVFKVKPPKKLYRGVSAGGGAGTYSLGKGLYSTPVKKFLKGFTFDSITELSPEEAFPRNPLVLRTVDAFTDWLLKESGEPNMRTFNAKWPDPGEFVRSKGYDGVWAGDEVVKYGEPSSPEISDQHQRQGKAKQYEKKGLASVQAVYDSLSDEDRDGLEVWHNPGPPERFIIDQMDWHNGVGGKKVIAAAEESTESEASEKREAVVRVQNEGGKPSSEDGWVKLSSEGE